MSGPQLPPEEPVFPSQLKDVRLSEGGAGGFSFRPRILETLVSAGMLAAVFLGMSILIIAVVPIPAHGHPTFGGVLDLVWGALFMWAFVAVPFIPVALFRATRRYGHATWAASAHGFLFAGTFWCSLWCFATPGESPGALNVAVVQAASYFMFVGPQPPARLLLSLVAAFVAAALASEVVIWSARPGVA
jgi:formate/nitrite transporter FocA (FNT family)